MPIVYRATERKRHPLMRQTRTVICILTGALYLTGGQIAHGQLSARLTGKKNIVKYSHNTVTFVDALLQQSLAGGDTLVTGKRSLAEVTFSDRSSLIMNESSRAIVTTGTRQRDVRAAEPGSAVAGHYNGPGRFRGAQALGAVRGTDWELIVEKDRDVIRCFNHEVVVTSANNSLITGTVTTPGAATIVSTDLIGNGENWIGARLVFTDGADKNQLRTVTAFDPVTGTITLNAPVPNANNLNTGFYIVTPNNAQVVLLEKNMETYVLHQPGAVPNAPYETEPLEFAGGDPLAFMTEPIKGDQQSHLTGYIHDRTRQSYYELDNGYFSSQGYGRLAPNIQTFSPKGTHEGGNPGNGNLNVGLGNGNGVGTGNLGVGIGNGNPNGNGNLIVNIGRSRAVGIFPQPPQIGGVGYSSEHSDTGLFYANDAAVLGSVYVRVGGRFGTLDRVTDNQLDELLARYRHPRFGDIQIGRFHWFPGPVSNGQLGRIIDFTSSDGILYQLPTSGTTTLQFAWFDKINPLAGPRVGGYAGRFVFPAGTGQIGLSALTTSQKTLGGSGDFVFPILPQKLEFYGEGGVDTAHQTIYAAGLYFPQLFHSFRADLSIELSYRGHFGHSVDAVLRLPFGKNFASVLTLSKPGPASWRPGLGLQARF